MRLFVNFQLIANFRHGLPAQKPVQKDFNTAQFPKEPKTVAKHVVEQTSRNVRKYLPTYIHHTYQANTY